MNFRRKLRMVLLEQVGFQKRFVKYQLYSVYRAAFQNRGWTRNIKKVGWERGMFQSWSLSQDRKIVLRRPRNSPCSVNPEFEPRADPQYQDSSPVAWTTHQFSIVWLDLFLSNRFLAIPSFLDHFLRDFLGRVCFSFPILHNFFSSL